ncbi:recombination regulator RecX [Alcaligenaceae bacterium B3P038]|nr:recombination regulator RecX [Alcaligenaceae bacterium B3P038]
MSRDIDDDDDEDFETLAPNVANSAAAKLAAEAAPAEPPAFARTSERKFEPKARKGRQLSLKARAVGFLSRREHSRQELARKLKPHVQETDNLEVTLDALEREGWLSTERYALSLVHRRATSRGTSRIVSELRQNGVEDHQIAELKSSLRDTEPARAREVWQKKFKGERPADAAQYAKQARFLAARGFSSDVVRTILGGRGGDFDEMD